MIALGPDVITRVFGFPVTNTILGTVATDGILIGMLIAVRKQLGAVPNGIQNVTEAFVEYFYTLTDQIAGSRAVVIFPWFASFFLFILFANLLGLIPGIGTFGLVNPASKTGELIPFIRSPSSDFNATFGLAFISLIATHELSIRYLGIIGYLKRFFSINPIYLFVGLLELVSEITKLISLSFRLFGNIVAGEVVLSTISSLFAYIAPIPFLMLESVVALVQALIFSMLTMVFMAILTTSHVEEVEEPTEGGDR